MVQTSGAGHVAFREKGVVFLDYAKDEKIWNEAMEEMRERTDTPTLKKMRIALREAVESGGSG